MKNVLKYKDFIGSVQYSDEDDVLFGKIIGINDLITYEGESISEIKAAFQNAVEDYIDLCERHNKPLRRSYKGSFNVRIRPELHQEAAFRSNELGISLNQFVEKAIAEKLGD
ncbi:MAG: type II toxin-antitoxin system HicB family antitoxin [Flavobacteriales bacterium]|nr:type II toxin-antitoxin system HicB family antitoxin [Flavobacteriales bacterium]